MQVSLANDVKVYNLTAGKSVPEWLEDRKRRKLISQDVELQQRIQLLQSFDMPTVSTKVKISPNGQYVFATGTYKPVVKCYDVQQLALKFERHFDSEVVNFLVLSEDYTKLVFLHEDRFIEFHNQGGKYYRLRVPRFGRDLCYNRRNCDLIVVGNSSDIYRINMEQGRFLQPYTSTQSSGFNVCAINDFHHLIAVGSQEGTVECWDPRTRKSVGSLNVAQFVDSADFKNPVETTCITFNDTMNLAVGTSTGQVMLFDIRSNSPSVVKDHHYEFPIHSISFSSNFDHNLVLSCDKKGVKAWHEKSAELVTAIEPTDCEITHMCSYPNSGLIFLAAETTKIHAYFVPSVGSAPKWCSFLENLTEEMEEDRSNVVYDDYKFVTRSQLEQIGLARLIGSKMLRAYMHGYFINVRLYNKAKLNSEPFAYEEFKQKKIKENLEKERHDRVKLEKLPSVNKETAVRLRTEKETGKPKTKREAEALLTDERFASKLFSDPDMQIDLNKEDLEVMNPVVLSRMVQLQPAMVQANQIVRQQEHEKQSSGNKSHSKNNNNNEDDENVKIDDSDSDNEDRLLANQKASSNNRLTNHTEEAENDDIASSDEEHEIKKMRKLAKKSAKIQQRIKQQEDAKTSKNWSQRPVSKLDSRKGGVELKTEVEMIDRNVIGDRDFAVPVRKKLSLHNLNAGNSTMHERLVNNEELSKQVQIGLNRSQTASIEVKKPLIEKVDKKKKKSGTKRSRSGGF